MTHPRLADPDDHFPYKRMAADTALATPPDPETNNKPEHLFTSSRIIAATDDYVTAQAAHLTDPSDETKADYVNARSALIAARAEHRKGRTEPVSIVADTQEG